MESLRGLSSSPASAYDELVTGQKSIRYHWQGILSVIRALPGGGLSERVESARRQLEESGATLNLLDDRGKPSWTLRSPALRHHARRMVGAGSGPDPARRAARRDAGRPLRTADPARRAAAAADAGPRQPPFPARLPGHRRQAAGPPSRPVCRRPGAPQRRPLARARRPHRGAVRRGLCARDPPRAGAQPARGLPLDPGAPSPAVRRPLAQFAGGPRTARRRAAQHGGADAGLAVGDLLRACLSRARARRAAGRRRRPGRARRRGADQDAGRPAPGAHAAAPARLGVRRSARAARRLGARRHRPGRSDAHRQDLARQRARLRPGRDAGDDAVPRTALPAPARPAAAAALARRVVAGRAHGLCFRDGASRFDDRAALPRPGPRADRGRHARSRGSARRSSSASPPSPASSSRSIPSRPRSIRNGTARRWCRRPSCCAAS